MCLIFNYYTVHLWPGIFWHRDILVVYCIPVVDDQQSCASTAVRILLKPQNLILNQSNGQKKKEETE